MQAVIIVKEVKINIWVRIRFDVGSIKQFLDYSFDWTEFLVIIIQVNTELIFDKFCKDFAMLHKWPDKDQGYIDKKMKLFDEWEMLRWYNYTSYSLLQYIRNSRWKEEKASNN